MIQHRDDRARQIQEDIRDVLLREWDPIGIVDVPEAQDEYDSYVGGVYRLLASGASQDQLVEHLRQIEIAQMGLSVPDVAHHAGWSVKLRAVVSRLQALKLRDNNSRTALRAAADAERWADKGARIKWPKPKQCERGLSTPLRS